MGRAYQELGHLSKAVGNEENAAHITDKHVN